jgi:hypothetical protein
MKRVSVVLMGLCFVVCCTASAHAWFGAKKKDAAQAPEQPVSADKAKKEAPAKSAAPEAVPSQSEADAVKAFLAKQEIVKKKMVLLNNTEWQIEMTPLSGKGKKEIDTATFKNNQVVLSGFSKKGFGPTNLTLTVQEDGSVVWETMQTSEKNGMCFWRGELDKTMMTMRGVASHKIDDKNKMDYSFVSTGRKVLTDK